MTSLGLSLEDVLPRSRKSAIIAQVEEVAALSPTPVRPSSSHINGVVYASTETDAFDLEFRKSVLRMSRSQSPKPHPPVGRVCPVRTIRQRSLSRNRDGQLNEPGSPLDKREVTMRLPPFTNLPGLPLNPRITGVNAMGGGVVPQGLLSNQLSQQHPSFDRPFEFGTSPLLTPPEEVDRSKWSTFPVTSSSSGNTTGHAQTRGRSSVAQISQQSHISIPPNPMTNQMPRGTGQPWLDRALEHTVAPILATSPNHQYLQMVAQICPLRTAVLSSSRPIFEMVLEALQARFPPDNPPYVNIMHAVPHMIAMDDVPTSPPATPNFRGEGGDYFDQQTVFSLAGVVPTYHNSNHRLGFALTGRPANPIVAPASVQTAVLERYIPPTSIHEYADFFSTTGKSYLIDRLAELSVNDGTLLLIYPTKQGATAFLSQYLNPVFEPLVRELIYFNGLFNYVGPLLGKMEATSAMGTYEQMESKITDLCSILSTRQLPRGGPRSTFSLAFSTAGEVMLDRSAWTESWIHQEHPRLRANLVEYQREGGRMPPAVGQSEATPATMARQLVEKLRGSKEISGGAEMEVGVFVIRRTSA